MTRCACGTVAAFFTAWFVLAGAAPAFAQGTMAMSRADTEAALIANEKKVNDAFTKADMAAFMSMVSDAGWSIDPGGMMAVKDVGKMMSEMKITDSMMDDFKVLWLDDDAAIVTYKWTGKGMYMGQPIPSPTMASTTWVKRDGKWWAIFHQETALMPMPMK